jgi:hypothetical protein
LDRVHHTAQTFPQLLLKHAAESPEPSAIRKKEYDIWQALIKMVDRMVDQMACGLHQAEVSIHAMRKHLLGYLRAVRI